MSKLNTLSELPEGHLPKHIAIIMDGSGRWASNHHIPRLAGHKKGANSVEEIVEIAMHYGIPYITLFAFSTENWNRPKEEVEGILRLLEENLAEGVRIALKKKIRIHHMGNKDGLPPHIQEKISEAIDLTKDHSNLNLGLAFNYGSRNELVKAMQHIVESGIKADDIDESLISRHLYTADFPDPDFIIRTGGERRLSNFLLWQSAYAELYFTPVLWPDFNKEEFEKALTDYSQRQRRFGKL